VTSPNRLPASPITNFLSIDYQYLY
jgi:hypothetical protein